MQHTLRLVLLFLIATSTSLPAKSSTSGPANLASEAIMTLGPAVAEAHEVDIEFKEHEGKLELTSKGATNEWSVDLKRVVGAKSASRIIRGQDLILVHPVTGFYAGYLNIDGEQWSLIPFRGKQLLLRLHASASLQCGVGKADAQAGEVGQEQHQAIPVSSEPTGNKSPAVQDVLVIYTDQVLEEIGGHAEVESLAEAAVQSTNVAYEESGANVRLHLVGAVLSAIHEEEASKPCPDCSDSPLVRIFAKMRPEAEELRELYHADRVAALASARDETQWTGLANGYAGPTASGDRSFFSITRFLSVVQNGTTFAHEVGHTQGLGHDPVTGCSDVSELPSGRCGHFNCDACWPVSENGVNCRWATIMTYGRVCPPGAFGIRRFSTPERLFHGEVLGIAGERDNVRVLNATAHAIAKERESPSVFPRFLVDPDYPDFRFEVMVEPSGAAPVFGTAVQEGCPSETLCVAGSLPNRIEAFVRIIGPRPNGYLWPTIVRFTPSAVRVGIERISTQEVRHYYLEPVKPPGANLSGLQDRRGFLSPE